MNMKHPALSPTRLEMVRTCEARMMAKYDKGFDAEFSEQKGDMAMVGILAHEAAKYWYRAAIADATDEQKAQGATLDTAFQAALEELGPKGELPKVATGAAEAKALFAQIVAFYDRDALTILFAERRYQGALPNGVPVNLVLDLGVGRADGTLEIIDYKTGFIITSYDEMFDKDQVLLNILAVSLDTTFAEYPQKAFRYFWVQSSFESRPVTMPPHALADYLAWMAEEYQRILAIEQPAEMLNRFCQSCGRRFRCTAFAELMTGAMLKPDLLDADALEGLSLDDVMARYETVATQIKLLDASKKVLSEYMQQAMEDAGAKELTGATRRVSLRQSGRVDFPARAVISLCAKYGEDPAPLMTVVKGRLDTAFSDRPEAMSELTLAASRTMNKAYVQIGKPKKERKPRAKRTKKAAPAETPAETPVETAIVTVPETPAEPAVTPATEAPA
jgi:RecB family exonuclease